MTAKKDHRKQENDLQKPAKNSPGGKTARIPKDREIQRPGDVLRLYNELQVHQIELVMQNEELRRTQRELEASRGRYFDLYDLAPVGYVTLSKTGQILETNLTAANMLGLARSALVNQPLTRFILPEDRDIYYHSHQALIETRTRQVCEIGVLRQGKPPFRCQMEVTMSEDACGTSVYHTMMSDVTERRKMEAMLRESEELFRLTFDRLPIGAAMVDADQRIMRANTEFCRMLGYSEEEITGVALKDITHPEDIPAELDNLRMMQNGGTDSFTMEKRYIRKDGSVVWGQLTAGMVRDSRSCPKYALRMVEDITGRKQTEKNLEERTAQLEEANNELESFSYSISHDIQTPLRAIDGFARIVLRKPDDFDENTRRQLNLIRDSTKVMGTLIEDLLAFSRTQTAPLKSAAIDMAGLAKTICDDLREVTKERTLEFQITEILPAYGDPALVRQVLFNLISNAVKFTKNRRTGIIKISSYPEAGRIVYCIRDNGAGFSMEYYNKLFGVFQRLHSNAEFEGTGIGLAIVQHIVKRHGGKVWAQGELDKGAAFYFTLPSKP